MKILITNSVAINGGDEALLRATILGLKEIFPSCQIVILSNRKDLCNHYIHDIDFENDWEYAGILNNNILTKIELYKYKIRNVLKNKFNINFLNPISLMLKGEEEKKILNLYKDSDLIISSAGGYIHDIYGYDRRAEIFEYVQNKNKKIVLLGQSIGPFFDYINHDKISKVLTNMNLIILREKLSLGYLKVITPNQFNTYVTTDIAFVLHKYYKNKFKREKTNNVVAVCFRQWKGNVETEKILNLGLHITKLILKNGYKVKFISTCQGVPNYIDDSKIATEIFSKLDSNEKANCIVTNSKFTLDNLLDELGNSSLYIGMRLHGAILSMLSGTPAFNLGYEAKTQGIYLENNLEDLYADYDQDINIIIRKINYFLENHHKIDLNKIVENANKKAFESFNILKNNI